MASHGSSLGDFCTASKVADSFINLKAQLPTIPEACERQKQGKKEKKRSKSLSISDSISLCLDEEDAFAKFYSTKGCRPLGLISNILACLHNQKGNCAPKFSVQTTKVEALVELNKRQQAALVDKQDTIDMLEWQIEQMQQMSVKERELQETSKKLGLSCLQIDEEQGGAEIGSGINPNCPVLQATATQLLLEMTIVRAALSIRKFCKVFMKQMEVSGYSVWRALADLEPRTSFLRKEHTAYALEARINRALFHCFESESFDEAGLTKILDPSKRCQIRLEEFQRMKLLDVNDAVNPGNASFEPEFFRFCENKTNEMWGMFPWNIVFKSSSERGVFTAAFIDAAKGVWLLHRLAFSMNPAASIVRVGRNMDANPLYVEAVAPPPQICTTCNSSKVPLATWKNPLADVE